MVYFFFLLQLEKNWRLETDLFNYGGPEGQNIVHTSKIKVIEGSPNKNANTKIYTNRRS